MSVFIYHVGAWTLATSVSFGFMALVNLIENGGKKK